MAVWNAGPLLQIAIAKIIKLTISGLASFSKKQTSGGKVMSPDGRARAWLHASAAAAALTYAMAPHAWAAGSSLTARVGAGSPSLNGSLAFSPSAQPATAVLPTGGVVQAGSVTIGAPTGGALTVVQNTAKGIINWDSFSVGQGGGVTFLNGSGATLNRVTGSMVSTIDGLLSATGSVYLINPNGVVIGKSGVVDVGGRFVGATLDIADSAFRVGGDLAFSGASVQSVINLGKIGALGGDVALIATTVRNEGSISAPGGAVGLLAGSSVLIRDASLDSGQFSVLVGAAGNSVTNVGQVTAAIAELRANGGNVYALAGDTEGVIRATGVSAKNGRIFLIAGDAGEVTVGGTLQARGADGAPGFIETSGGRVTVDAAHIDAGQGGTWSLDPNDIAIDQAAANTIAGALNTGTNVTQQTTATGSGGQGDITVNPNVKLNWSTGAGLTLSAYRNINLGAGVALTSTGGGTVSLLADNMGTGAGTVTYQASARITTSGAVSIYYNPDSFIDTNSQSTVTSNTSYPYTTTYSNPYAALAGGATTLRAYMLVNDLAHLQAMNTELDGLYVVGHDIDASGSASMNPNGSGGYYGFNPIGTSSTPFVGVLEGAGHTISGLTITRTSGANVGLFGVSNGTLRNFSLTSVNVAGLDGVGSAVGQEGGSVLNVRSSGTVSGRNNVGGLIGYLYGPCCSTPSVAKDSFVGSVSGSGTNTGGLVGYSFEAMISASSANGIVKGGSDTGGLVGLLGYSSLTTSYSSGSVSGSNAIGGLVGAYSGCTGCTTSIIDQSYSSANVIGSSTHVGGLVGESGWVISNSYATGSVTGGGAVGGLVGFNSGSLTNVYATGRLARQGSCINESCSAFGGVVGQNYGGSIQNAYWDQGTSSQPTGVGYGADSGTITNVTGIGGYTGIDPYTQATYRGFDLTTSGPWVIFNGDTRPILRSEASTTVTNAHQLQLMALTPGVSFVLANDIDASGTKAGDVWNPATGFVPIGNHATPFTASFNGKGHAISGLFINRPATDNVGLFGYATATSSVQAVGITGADITGRHLVGALVGENGGSVNGYSEGAVKGVNGYYIGGLIGLNAGQITSSASTASVSGSTHIGGLVGFNQGGVAGSTAYGVVAGTSYVAGGLIGFNAGAVSNSSAHGPVSGGVAVGGLIGLNSQGSTSTGDFASGAVTGAAVLGGLIGQMSDHSSSTQDYATGAVSGGTSGYYVGGLVGINYGSIAQDHASGSATGSTHVGGLVGYSTGAIGASYASGGQVTASSYAAGGLVGYNLGDISYSAAADAVKGGVASGGLIGFNAQNATSRNNAAFGSVTGGNEMGGLIGENAAGATSRSDYATGSVDGGASAYYIGGLVGVNSGALLDDSSSGYAKGGTHVGGLTGLNGGAISSSYATGASFGSSYSTGGLVGLNTGSINNAYATGAVSGSISVGGLVGVNAAGSSITAAYATGVTTGIANVGGFAGQNAGSLSFGYWDIGTSSQGAGLGQNSGGAGATGIGAATGRDPMLGSTYAGLDLNGEWTITPSTRPTLRFAAHP